MKGQRAGVSAEGEGLDVGVLIFGSWGVDMVYCHERMLTVRAIIQCWSLITGELMLVSVELLKTIFIVRPESKSYGNT